MALNRQKAAIYLAAFREVTSFLHQVRLHAAKALRTRARDMLQRWFDFATYRKQLRFVSIRVTRNHGLKMQQAIFRKWFARYILLQKALRLRYRVVRSREKRYTAICFDTWHNWLITIQNWRVLAEKSTKRLAMEVFSAIREYVLYRRQLKGTMFML